MRIPKIKGIIRRRLLVNFRADAGRVRLLLPDPFRPKLHAGHAIVGICLIRLENIRPCGLPAFVGLSSENAAHRIAIEWEDASGRTCEGVYIPRRDSDSWLNRLAGGRVFPGEHHFARFRVMDRAPIIQLSYASTDGAVSVDIEGREGGDLPKSSCFCSLDESSRFFEGGSLGYSPNSRRAKSEGLLFQTSEWQVRPLAVSFARSSFFEDAGRFPNGTVAFDHALIMRNIEHEWHSADDIGR